MQRRRALIILSVFVMASVACSVALNPQPLPPEAATDRGDDGGSFNASVDGAAAPVPGKEDSSNNDTKSNDAGDAGDAATEADAGSDGGEDAGEGGAN